MFFPGCCLCTCPCCWRCLSLLSLFSECLLSTLFHGLINIGSTQICDLSCFKRFHLWIHLPNSLPVSRNPTHPPVFIAPRILVYRKTGVSYLNGRYLRIFDRFLLVVQSIINRFWNGFHSRIALGMLYNIAAQSLSRNKLRCIKIIIETFERDIRFPCVSSVVFEAKSI